MNENKTQTGSLEDADVEYCELVVNCFISFFENLHATGESFTERPLAQSLLDIMQEMFPASRNSPLSKYILCFEAGFDYGVRVWDALNPVDKEEG